MPFSRIENFRNFFVQFEDPQYFHLLDIWNKKSSWNENQDIPQKKFASKSELGIRSEEWWSWAAVITNSGQEETERNLNETYSGVQNSRRLASAWMSVRKFEKEREKERERVDEKGYSAPKTSWT